MYRYIPDSETWHHVNFYLKLKVHLLHTFITPRDKNKLQNWFVVLGKYCVNTK